MEHLSQKPKWIKIKMIFKKREKGFEMLGIKIKKLLFSTLGGITLTMYFLKKLYNKEIQKQKKIISPQTKEKEKRFLIPPQTRTELNAIIKI